MSPLGSPCHEGVKEPPEQQRHIPGINYGLGQADKEASNSQPFETGEELKPGLMQFPIWDDDAGRDAEKVAQNEKGG